MKFKNLKKETKNYRQVKPRVCEFCKFINKDIPFDFFGCYRDILITLHPERSDQFTHTCDGFKRL